MSHARYFLPDQPKLQGVYSKNDLRTMLQKGALRRGDMVLDDETGLAHLLGDLLARPQRADTAPPDETTGDVAEEHDEAATDDGIDEDDGEEIENENHIEFRADTPLPVTEHEAIAEDEEYDDSEDEHLVKHLRPSWFSYTKSVFFALVCGAAAGYVHLERIGLPYEVAGASLAALALLRVALVRMTTDYYITDERVETETGIVGRNSNEVRICDIRAIDVRMSGITALLGIGTVDFCSAGGSAVDVQFLNIRRPHHIKHIVRELQGA